MSNIHTLTELNTVVTKQTYDNDIKKMAKICQDINDKYLAEARKNIKGNKMVEILAEKLRNAISELNKLKKQPQIISGGDTSFFSKLINEHIKTFNTPKDELDQINREVEDEIKAMGF